MSGAGPREHLTRRTVCLSRPEPNLIVHNGDASFEQELGKLYNPVESRLIENLLELKSALRHTSSDEFWAYLAERLADLLDSQMAFVSKRMLVDEQDAAVEMPPIGEPGACLMASALFYNDGKGTSDTFKAFKYHAYGCPCGYMRHDKVFIIPDHFNDFITDNPNELPFACESYIGVPLFEDGKCFAHFGVLWSPEGVSRRKLSWTAIELALHALEDIILDRLLEGTKFRDPENTTKDRNRIIPHSAITAAQSLKPYARSLSHELRTPMQGVVGMLDVMYATVLEASEAQMNPDVRRIFETLKENIEVVQDSSRRAVEAADNVVHAYDMDLSVPEAPHSIISGSALASSKSTPLGPGIQVAGSNLPIQRPNKRRRENEGTANQSPAKIHATIGQFKRRAEPSDELKKGVMEAEEIPDRPSSVDNNAYEVTRLPSPPKVSERLVAPGFRHTQLRTVLQYVVNEGLKVGGRPESAIARETDTGEIIEVRLTKSTGEALLKVIEWSVDPIVPSTVFVDEKDLGKLISCVFLNAIKFTEQGKITVHARMSSKSRHVVIDVTDSGPGIPKAFLPRLFKPFSQEDPSLTRKSEGLGLGLLVAKGLARKMGGDLMCSRTETEGATRGTIFEIRIPVAPTDQVSRPPSPADSPSSRSIKTFTPRSEEPPSFTSMTDLGIANPFPTPSESDDTLQRTPSEETTKMLRPSPSRVGLMRKPSLPQTPNSVPTGIPPLPPPTKPDHKLFQPAQRPAMAPRKSSASLTAIDRELAQKHPLTFLVAEDNKINRKLLVSMLTKFGYTTVYEAYDGAEAVRQMQQHSGVDVILMDLWMPFMDGYEATEKILAMDFAESRKPTVLAVTADVTDGALERAAQVGMQGFMTKPFKLLDLQRLILEYCTLRADDLEV